MLGPKEIWKVSEKMHYEKVAVMKYFQACPFQLLKMIYLLQTHSDLQFNSLSGPSIPKAVISLCEFIDS